MHRILLDGIYVNTNLLVQAGNFGALTTDKRYSVWYYIVICFLDYSQCNMKLPFME